MKIDYADVDYADEVNKTEVLDSKKKEEWHPRYERAGIWARQFIKQYIKILIVYGIWGFVLGLTFKYGGYAGLIISGTVAILYTIKNGFEQLLKKDKGYGSLKQ
jgi:hypothetical protein